MPAYLYRLQDVIQRISVVYEMAGSRPELRLVRSSEQDTHLHPLGLENQPLHESRSNPWNNPKKRPSTSDLGHHPDAAQLGLGQSNESNGADSHPQKRSRAADWPLRSTDDSTSSIITHRPTNKSPISPAQRRKQARMARPSVFLEGSMNDRVSKKPPSIYLGDDAAMDLYHNQTSSHNYNSHDTSAIHDEKTYYDAGIETAKPSGMYRFGKALASAFNPVSVWQGISGYRKVKDDHKQPDKIVLQERKIKAEKAYAELKNGFRGTQPFAFRGSSIDRSGFSERTSHRHSMDSTLDFDHHHASALFKDKQPTPAGSEDMLIASALLRSRCEIAPLAHEDTGRETGRKTSLSLPRPSLQGLKKAKSHFNLSAPKRKAADAALLSPKSDHPSESNNEQRLTRQPSKKDIAKQRKLSKQVSDLESKLQTARRELELSRGQVPEIPKIPKSGRKPFKPGALPSLPSESFLNSTEESFPAESDSEWKPSTSRKRREQSSTPKKPAIKTSTARTTPLKGKAQNKGQESAPTSSGKKRKLSGERASDRSYKSGHSTDNGSDSDLGTSVKKASRARRAQEQDAFICAADKPTSKHSLVGASRGTQKHSSQVQPAVPPVPALSTRFDRTKVDTQKLLAMRSVPKDHLPFGSHLDDIVNLQKEYPHVGQKLLDEYLSGLSKNNKPGLNAASPSKAVRPEDTSARGRQACKNSSPNRSGAKNLSTIDEAITLDPSKDRSIPPLPRSPMKDMRNPTRSRTSTAKPIDKPLPDIQKEDYKWPEDVF
ncbi:MAG: hypothetical protein L6R38_008341 [Xanthoria sp. 2 TBL-2021]|nr:MAG: hypothetical protein L6R38_008341 [Xanthoria sp. 2 TBL-2021]